MKSSSRALLALVIFVGLAIGLLAWSVQYNRAKAEEMEKQILSRLSADDIKTILESQAQGNPQQLAALKEDPETRKEILEQLRGLLAQAAEARREGLADDPNFKNQLAISEKVIVARAYDLEQTKGQPAPPFGYVSKEEVDAYWTNPAHDTEFQKAIDGEVASIKAAGQPAPKIEGETLKRAREQYARMSLTFDKATADTAFMDKRDVQLQVALQQSLLLAREYATKKLAKEVEPTKPEINAYLAAHPEYDSAKQRAKAEDVLRRALAGEDFAALANQYSEDPGNKDPQTGEAKGGLYENISQGSFVPEFEAAALALENGQIVPNLVETQYGYHIIKLEEKKVGKGADGKEGTIFSARHILLQNKFPAPNKNPNPMARPQLLGGEDIARAAVGEEKQKKVIEELVARNKIELPEDFTVDVPEGPDGRQPLPQQLPPGMEMPPEGKSLPPGAKPMTPAPRQANKPKPEVKK